jgi:hypothetical protein
MAINIDRLLSLDPTEQEIEVSAGAERGSVRVTVRELPYGIARRCSLRYLGALQAYEAARKGLDGLGDAPLPPAAADALAGALSALYEAQREVVRFGVSSHRAEDFLAGAVEIPFEPAESTFNGQPYRVASERMLRLYVIAGGGRLGTGDAGELLPALAEAVLAFQRPESAAPQEGAPPGGGAAASPLPSVSE